jgi:hypothetical protein
MATLTGLEPATSAVTGRRANQLRHRALFVLLAPRCRVARTPYGIRTRATALKGRRPRPLDEGGQSRISPGYSQRFHVRSHASLGHRDPNPQTSPGQPPSILIAAAPIAQLVELRTFNPQVLGSSPSGGTARAVGEAAAVTDVSQAGPLISTIDVAGAAAEEGRRAAAATR